jgi:hypothetical protein
VGNTEHKNRQCQKTGHVGNEENWISPVANDARRQNEDATDSVSRENGRANGETKEQSQREEPLL